MFLKPEHIEYRRVSRASEIMNKPGYIVSIEVQGDENGAFDATFYDGIDDQGDVFAVIRGPQYTRKVIKYTYPRRVNNGLYVDDGSNVEEFVIGFTYRQFTDLDLLETSK